MKRFCKKTGNMEAPLTRRGFLAAAAGLSALAACGVREKGEIKVGAHPWVYAATQPNNDITPILDDIFSDMDYAGMDGIELMHTALRPDDAVERIDSLSQKYGLPIIGTSFGGDFWNRDKHPEILDDAEKVIARLAHLGGQTLGTSVGKAEGVKTPAQLDAQADLLRKIIKICETKEVTLNLHNHTYEVENDLFDLKETLKRVPDVKLGPDLDWLVQAGVDPVSFIRDYGEKIVFLHVRDQKKDKTWVESLGEGDMDYKAVANALHEVGFSGYAVIELAHPANFQLTRPLRESLKMSREYLQTALG